MTKNGPQTPQNGKNGAATTNFTNFTNGDKNPCPSAVGFRLPYVVQPSGWDRNATLKRGLRGGERERERAGKSRRLRGRGRRSAANQPLPAPEGNAAVGFPRRGKRGWLEPRFVPHGGGAISNSPRVGAPGYKVDGFP